MLTAYNSLLTSLLIILSPLWLVWMWCVPKLRAGFWEKCGVYSDAQRKRLTASAGKPRVWVHAVSVGELNAAQPLVQALIAQGKDVVLSTTTATGHALAQHQFKDLPLFYFPFDLPWILHKTFDVVNPQQIVMMETEIWPNLLAIAQQRRIPVVLVNGRLSQGSYQGYKRFKAFFAPVLNGYTHLLMQSADDAQRMRDLGAAPQKVSVCGNIKFDAPAVDYREQIAALCTVLGFPPQAQVLVFASTHAGEDELFLQLFDDLKSDFPLLRAIFAPRHPERFRAVAMLLQTHAAHFVLRSQLTADTVHSDAAHPIVLLDTIGELPAVLHLATVTCMGGSFVDWGGHNPLESLRAGVPVIFGPYMHNFADITRLILQAHAGFQTPTLPQAEQTLRDLLTRPEYYAHIVRNAHKLMVDNQGALDKILGVLLT